MTDEQMKETMAAFQKDMMAKQAAAKKATGEKNAAEGKKFLAENKAKEGVKTTASGLQYKVLKEGTGPSPKATDTVKVNYRGTTIDGTEFDSSYKRGEPATFPGQSRDQRLDRSAPADEGRLEISTLHSRGSRLRRARRGFRHRAECDADLRSGIARDRPARHDSYAETGGLRLEPPRGSTGCCDSAQASFAGSCRPPSPAKP